MKPRSEFEFDHAALWRQRLFEAEADMTNYLVRVHRKTYLDAWIKILSEVFHDLPVNDLDDVEGWKKSFFRAQALLERFLIGLFGEEVITDWAVENAKIYSQLEPGGFGKATTPIRRIERQAKLYGSICAVSTDDSARSVIRIDRCAIWDYREAARARGVPITLRSPCTYCTRSMSENIQARGCVPNYQLREIDGIHGCEWIASRP